jgi:multidrug efflux pump subunit AcrA (membrane-fusion protein)
MTVPTTALQSDAQGQFYVWIFDPASGAVTRRAVSVGRPGGDGVMVERGLEEGELVVAAGASQLQDGMRVRPLGEVVGKE